jgi:hypothetical protein
MKEHPTMPNVTREELAEAARAYRDLCACYRTTEKLFDRLSRANATLSRLDAEQNGDES